MAFGEFKSLQAVLQTYQVRVQGSEFVQPAPLPVNPQSLAGTTETNHA